MIAAGAQLGSERPLAGQRALPALVFAAGLLITAIATLVLADVLQTQKAERFENAVEQAHSAIGARMEAYLAVLQAGAGLVAAQEGLVTQGEFDAFASRLELPHRYPGVQGLGYSVRLPELEGPAAEATLSRLEAAHIKVRPQTPRPEAHAIVFLHPLDQRNLAALGYDMFSHPVRRAAMERARDTGGPAISHKVQLVQEITPDKQAGFLIYNPVYGGAATPRTAAERRARLLGFVYAPFRADDLLAGIFQGQARPRLHFAVYDREIRPENLLHKTFDGSLGDIRDRSSLRAVRDLEVAGGRWRIAYYPRTTFENGSDRGVLWAFVVGGLVASILLTSAAWWQMRARLAAEAEVAVRRAGEAQRELLLGELNHRVKNTLATVQSIAAQTLREGKTLAETREAFESRILALSQTHNLLTRTHWRGAGLRELVELELAPYRGQGDGRLAVDGEDLLLEPGFALALGMAIHELATNAAKYGALSVPGGEVKVRWSTHGEGADRRLRLDWIESGGPTVRAPERKGFGTRLITSGLRRQLGGEVELNFPPEGVQCVIDAPLAVSPQV